MSNTITLDRSKLEHVLDFLQFCVRDVPMSEHASKRLLEQMKFVYEAVNAPQESVTSAQQSDSVAEAGSMPGTDGFTMACFRAAEVPIGTKLYVHPQACRQSLGDDEIRAGLHEAIEHATQYERAAFIKGVKFAERAHSVGGGR